MAAAARRARVPLAAWIREVALASARGTTVPLDSVAEAVRGALAAHRPEWAISGSTPGIP